MAAAFTHVVADTLRTISVFLAAIVSSATGIKGSVCDACAAIGVSITIRKSLESNMNLSRNLMQEHHFYLCSNSYRTVSARDMEVGKAQRMATRTSKLKVTTTLVRSLS